MSSPDPKAKSRWSRVGTLVRRSSTVLSPLKRPESPTPSESPPVQTPENNSVRNSTSRPSSLRNVEVSTSLLPPAKDDHVVPSPIAESPAREAAELASERAPVGPSPLAGGIITAEPEGAPVPEPVSAAQPETTPAEPEIAPAPAPAAAAAPAPPAAAAPTPVAAAAPAPASVAPAPASVPAPAAAPAPAPAPAPNQLSAPEPPSIREPAPSYTTTVESDEEEPPSIKVEDAGGEPSKPSTTNIERSASLSSAQGSVQAPSINAPSVAPTNSTTDIATPIARVAAPSAGVAGGYYDSLNPRDPIVHPVPVSSNYGAQIWGGDAKKGIATKPSQSSFASSVGWTRPSDVPG